MIIIKVKNVGIFLAIFTLILGINLGLGGLNSRITLVSFAQETEETEETVEVEETQETPATEEAVREEETEKTEEETEAEKEEELDIFLTGDYITYEKIEGEDLIIAKDGVELKYQDIEVK
ncbi:unnamed protein product, partial [marine sediment metagenome]